MNLILTIAFYPNKSELCYINMCFFFNESDINVSLPNGFIYLNFFYQTRAKNNISIVQVQGFDECYRADLQFVANNRLTESAFPWLY